ncbi:subtilisin-like protease SBT1.7 isoform X3 [Asparagus officinalis]|uniref:subtilisin-like protease SBT1.7 isoform X1 n=2 Tax=Asparagus officinalis TaxID=4686 RepID=UPI00098E581C|nr:subtilisin-like protease SBT1.7 isoform X1 [Asparagus officinalis]XP_020242401.1 subtilisin-like protease SBT1.7 isoform X2 [Asparagus officinalis]XP_020242402.1 subtilisin-like protease SBT1.7 isoform X3 [Asparagus officinalis]
MSAPHQYLLMMAQNKAIPFLLSSIILLLVSNFLTVQTLAQLLPIVNPNNEANTHEIQTYIVQVDGIDDAGLLSYEDRESWYMSFLPNTTLDSGEPRLLYSYRHVLNGFAARLTNEELKAMESNGCGFVICWNLTWFHPLGTTYTPQFLELNQYGKSIWAKSKGGEGVVIGVLDTGIVPNHPSFNDTDMPDPPKKWRGCCQFQNPFCNRFQPAFCNKKLIGARLSGFLGDPLDDEGHGTHCAGIATGVEVFDANVLGQGRGTAVGMAPKAHLASYKTCVRGGCNDWRVLAGVDEAIEDGVDVLSMSIVGGFVQFYEDGVMRGSFVAMEKGILTSACAGNEGRIPFSISNDAPWVMTVGASTTDRVMRVLVELGNGMKLYGESAYQPEDYKSPWLPIAYPGIKDTDAKLSCMNGSLDDENVKGMMVLCGEMNSLRLDKGRTVKEAQGDALIVLNQKWNGFTTWAEAHVLPAAHLSHVDSLKIVNYAKTEKSPKARLFFKGMQFHKRRAPAVIDISSRGPSTINGGILKPDIIGPGSDILSAWAFDVGPDSSARSDSAFNIESGCSMATPHLAGIAALIKSIHNDWSPAAIKSAIMTTADILDHDGLPIVDEKSNSLETATYFAMGAGHVNPSRAMDPGLVYDVDPEDYVRYLCGLYSDANNIKKIIKRDPKCYKLQHITPEELNYPSVMVSLSSSSAKTISRTVTFVEEKGPAVYKLKDSSDPEGTVMEIEPKELHFSSPKESKTFTVKFSKKGSSPSEQYTQGQFSWVSGEHIVRSPVVVKHSN